MVDWVTFITLIASVFVFLMLTIVIMVYVIQTNSKVNGMSSQISANTTAINSLNTNVSALTTQVNTVSAQTTALTAQLAGFITATNTNFGTVNATLSSITFALGI
jgi:peptidoglycan hydrolase CwlO-like protein